MTKAPAPRLVILTGNGPEHRYVANRLCGSLPIEAVIVDVSARAPSIRRAFRGGMHRGVARLALFAFRKAVRDTRARDRALRDVLGRDATARFLAEDRVTRVEGINSADARRAVTATRPDVLLVFGTAIVRDEVLALARRAAFNMHTGLSPRYRGTDCAFWPVVNGELDCIGATVHECTSAVDGGQMFARGRARCEPGDGVHEVFAHAVSRGADLYVDTVRRHVAGDLTGEPQDLSTGVEYRGYMRTLRPELRARWALMRLRRQAAG